MKTIIAGGRDYRLSTDDLRYLDRAGITEVVSGVAAGVDDSGEDWAAARCIPIKQFPADWDKLGRSAGPIRNKQMAKYADSLIAFWNGKSPGTKSMINIARKEGIQVTVVDID